MKKKNVKKLSINRETLQFLQAATGGTATGYATICLCSAFSGCDTNCLTGPTGGC